ncbi:hypothetical protein SpAn4DRAFT_4730 [Sporomusa ovata]|uniref:Uncharacterized protein n=1 Tax=Sporomusa ovata TaxID=2378 RepID=A0A0U1KX89_9FIRM|nr:hypothetical protein SpAn4DRAFT_4730 [Sporomusa ovata]
MLIHLFHIMKVLKTSCINWIKKQSAAKENGTMHNGYNSQLGYYLC